MRRSIPDHGWRYPYREFDPNANVFEISSIEGIETEGLYGQAFGVQHQQLLAEREIFED